MGLYKGKQVTEYQKEEKQHSIIVTSEESKAENSRCIEDFSRAQ